MEQFAAAIKKIEAKRGFIGYGESNTMQSGNEEVRDPAPCKTKRRRKGGASSSGVHKNPKRLLHCSACEHFGHNRKTCAARKHNAINTQPEDVNIYDDDPNDGDEMEVCFNVCIVHMFLFVVIYLL